MNDANYQPRPFRWIAYAVLAVGSLFAGLADAQVVPPLDGADQLVSLTFRDTPLDQVLRFYSERTGRTMITAPGVNASITLRSETRITVAEALQAIESALAMHNVVLVPMGERFLRVVQTPNVRQEGLPISQVDPEVMLPETDQIMSLIIHLTHVEISEVQPIIQQLIHGYGKIQPLERTNSIMITDTSSNLNRVLEIIEFVDRPVEMLEDIHVRPIQYAEAGEIASRLNEFIQDREENAERPAVATPPTEVERRGPPGVIRAPRPETAPAATPATMDAAAELAQRGIIRGRVKIVADERINTLFIISRPVNFAFFDTIIDILDQPVEPEVIVRVLHLDYALAEDIAGILNEFIGAASSEDSGRGLAAGATGEDSSSSRAEALRDFAAGLARERLQQAADAGNEASSKIGRLSENTKILSDQRSNALLLMGRRGDIAALEEIIDHLDIMLGQVLIEAVIVEINLGNTQETGIDWLQRTLNAYSDTVAGPGGGLTVREPVLAFGGGSRPGALGDMASARQSLLDGIPPVGAGGLSYYLTFFDLNIDAIIRLAATSRDARILSTPVILTTDNTEAQIIVGESRPIVTSTASSSVGDRQVSSYQYRDIGIDLTVTPRINPQRFVVMEISQSADNVGGDVEIDGNLVPIITRREMKANIAVRSEATIVLGGLISTDRSVRQTKVPLLGDIPLLGRLFRSDSEEEARTELLVLITPYVMMTPQEARSQTERLHQNSHSSRTEWHTGWSESEFATPVTIPDERLSRRERRALQEEVREAIEAPEEPLAEGTYDPESVEPVLHMLEEQESQIQEEPVGIIEWQQTTESVVAPPEPVETPEPEPVETPELEPVEMVPDEVPVPMELYAPIPRR
jgi:general secretion pathway protein D